MADAAQLQDLRTEMLRLGPWHLEVEIAPGLSTREWLEAGVDGRESPVGRVNFIDARARFEGTMRAVYPGGLAGRSMLDCACNCGAYLFWAKELGAGEGFGFDVREHWIEQARFLLRHRTGPSDDLRFEVCDLYDLPKLGLEPFDVVNFKGIFYHLPEPVGGMKVAADLTKELLIVNTAARRGYPDGALVVAEESRTGGLSGIYGLTWVPTGPGVMRDVLHWMGFPEVRCSWWTRRGTRKAMRERMEVLAARSEGFFDAFDAARASGPFAAVRAIVSETVPEGATVMVASSGEDEAIMLGDRCGWHFPQDERGFHTSELPSDDEAAIAHLEELRGEGAGFIVFPAAGLWWLERYPGLACHLEREHRLVAREDAASVFALTPAG